MTPGAQLLVKRLIIVIFQCCSGGALLAGCATGPTVPATVLVPVATPCLSAPPPEKPATVEEAELLAMSDYAATLQTYTERLLLKAWAEKAEALLSGCR